MRNPEPDTKPDAETVAAVLSPLVATPEPMVRSMGSKGVPLILAVLFALMPIVLLAIAVYAPSPLAEPLTVVIPRGKTVRDIAETLADKGVITNALLFRAVVKIFAPDMLRSGEYQFVPGQNIINMVLMIRDGRSVLRLFVVPEGLTSYDIVGMLRTDPALTGEVASIPAEGSLMPESYRYSYGDSRTEIITRMQKAAKEVLKDEWATKASDVPLQSPEEALVMASIIEKETGKKAEERPRVAGVFYNRLRQGMRLQSDPTVLYALTNGKDALERELTHADMATPSPMNTYVNTGLPPHPICNPGKASLTAALHPEKNDFLYFVADGTGGHAFATDLATHNQNIAKWLSASHP